MGQALKDKAQISRTTYAFANDKNFENYLKLMWCLTEFRNKNQTCALKLGRKNNELDELEISNPKILKKNSYATDVNWGFAVFDFL